MTEFVMIIPFFTLREKLCFYPKKKKRVNVNGIDRLLGCLIVAGVQN